MSESDLPVDAGPAIMRATRRGQTMSALLVVMALAALVAFQFVALPMLLAAVGSRSGMPPSGATVRLLQAIFGGIGLLGLGTAAILIHQGRQILRLNQSPASDLWLWRDTPVVRGAKARRRAWLSIALALMTALICIGLVSFIVLTLQRLAPYALRPGVTVIEQKTWQP